MAAKLSKGQRTELARHSREGTEKAGARITRFLVHDRWLGKTNVYGPNAAEKLKRDNKAKRAAQPRALAEYIAASAPQHALDGWAYVSRALNAAVAGDADAARHLAYYAELRAALSLLASQGIGIFNGHHAVIEKGGNARTLKGHPTHVMTWLVLRWWMGRAEAARAVGKVVAQAGEPIETWIGHMPGGGSWTAVGTGWLASWGIDLRDAFHDRGARNRASYSPTRLYNARALAPVETAAFVSAWWRGLEPIDGAPFEGLDRHLLRASLEAAFEARSGKSPADAKEAFEKEVAAAKEAVTGDGSLQDSLGRFLTRAAEPATWRVLREAGRHEQPDSQGQHLQVMSRASLLLRLASGSAADLMVDAGLSESRIRFWIEGVGEDRALWAPGAAPTPLTDLWDDVKVALDDLETLQPPDPDSYRRLQDACGSSLPVLSSAERVAVWGAAA